MKKYIFNTLGLGLMTAMTLSSCSDNFLEEKKNYDNVTPTEVYADYTGASARVNDIYAWCLPDANAEANWKYNCTGVKDEQSKSTEEFSGFTVFTNPQQEMSVANGNVPDYFQNTLNNIQASVWGRIRNINDCIAGIEQGTLSESQKNELLGQVYFFRAWCYYQLVKWYGGVPIIKEVQDVSSDSYTPRSSAKECIEFIVEDLDKSAELLASKGGWSGSDWGRVSAGTALALKGRVLMLWCSPLFNRANDTERWTSAYNTMKQDLTTIDACGYGLYTTSNNVNGSDFAGQFSQIQSKEAVFVTLYNNLLSGDGQKNNSWERYIRPKNTTGSGYNASAMLVDLFPMSDGKIPAGSSNYTLLERSDSASSETDIHNYPFMNRDPRFYRTFAFPGVRWAYNGDPTVQDANNPSYNNGQNYELWNYVWYTNTNDAGDVESGNDYGADNLLSDVCGIYVRKRSDDYDVNGSPLYNFQSSQKQGFAYSAAPYAEIRYAEVLLNLAEAACGAGDLDYAVEQLKKIRARAGYTAANNYGLQSNLTSNQAACMSAILYERQIEFAYEGKRFDDMRRWLLFDGGANFKNIDGAPASWTLTGWGGNTCTWLGITPMNGQRRENMEYRTADTYGVGGTTYDSDPLTKAGVERCAAIDLRKSDLHSQEEVLKKWYTENLVYKQKKGDSYDSNKVPLYINYLPRYYFLGLSMGAMNNNLNMPQTIGWTDRVGSAGTFDPFTGE